MTSLKASGIAAFLFCLVMAACQTPGNTGFQLTNLGGDDVLADDTNIVVLVDSDRSANRLLVNAARRGYQLREKFNLASLDLIMLNFKRPNGVSGPVAISDMLTMAPNATAGVEHLFTLQGDQAQLSPRIYAEQLVDWPQSGCSAQITVGIIDGDVDLASPQLSGANIVKRDFASGDAAAGDHGTAIANLLIGPGRLHSGRPLYAATVVSNTPGQTGAGVREIIRALDWMLESDVKLVNISLSGPYNALLERAIMRSTNRGLVVVAAAGNDGPQAEPQYPAAFENVIAVTAVDKTLEIYSKAVQGDHIDFSAPGVDVFVDAGETGSYLSGTSVAAPFVTALIASAPFMTSNQDLQTLRQLVSESSIDLGPEGRDPIFGRGLVKRGWRCG